MSILVIYSEEPTFPATDQHPDAVRYKVGAYWVDAIGGEPTQAEVGAIINPPVTLPDLAPYQFRAMLKLSGKQDDLYAFIEALPEPIRTVAQSKLEYSLSFKRDNDLVVGARAGLGLTDAELDALWLQAASIL